MGNVQLLTGNTLKLAVQRGFDAPFLDFFATVDDAGSVCGAALLAGQRIVVDEWSELHARRLSSGDVNSVHHRVILGYRLAHSNKIPLILRIG
jgi:hypothetical protein